MVTFFLPFFLIVNSLEINSAFYKNFILHNICDTILNEGDTFPNFFKWS